MPGYQRTSERMSVDEHTWTDEDEYLIYLCHLATYEFATRFTPGATVLDYGCGTGYGTQLIGRHSHSVVGVDVSPEAVEHARQAHPGDNVEYRVIRPVEEEQLPFADRSFDVVLSFQVIEHVADPARYVAEAIRVLALGGVLIVVTPERTTRLFPRQRPWNRFHLHEFSASQLRALLVPFGEQVELFGMGGARLSPEVRRSRRLRLLAYPFTFPGAPERWRQFGLGGAKSVLVAMRSRLRRRPHPPNPDAGANGAPQTNAGSPDPTGRSGPAFGYGTEVVEISAGVKPSLNIVAVFRKSEVGSLATSGRPLL